MGFLIWEHPYIVRICPVLWWESWNWCEHQSHLSSGMLPAITLVRSGARNGRTGARASCELGLNPLLSGYHQLIRRRDRSQVSWEKPRQSWPSRCVFFPLLAPVSSPRRGTLLEKEGLVWCQTSPGYHSCPVGPLLCKTELLVCKDSDTRTAHW